MRFKWPKERNELAEIHICVYPPEGWADSAEVEEATQSDIERLTREVKTLVARFDSPASAHVCQD